VKQLGEVWSFIGTWCEPRTPFGQVRRAPTLADYEPRVSRRSAARPLTRCGTYRASLVETSGHSASLSLDQQEVRIVRPSWQMDGHASTATARPPQFARGKPELECPQCCDSQCSRSRRRYGGKSPCAARGTTTHPRRFVGRCFIRNARCSAPILGNAIERILETTMRRRGGRAICMRRRGLPVALTGGEFLVMRCNTKST
jgi:hypothetical protein